MKEKERRSSPTSRLVSVFRKAVGSSISASDGAGASPGRRLCGLPLVLTLARSDRRQVVELVDAAVGLQLG